MGSYLKYSRKRISRHALRNLLWTRQTLSLTVQSLNLPVVSKLLERIVVKQLLTHLDMHQLLPRLQSAYRSKHSTETALVKVISDILLATDAGDLAALVLLTCPRHLILSTTVFCFDHLKRSVSMELLYAGSNRIWSADGSTFARQLLFQLPLSLFAVYHRVLCWASSCFYCTSPICSR